MSSSCFRTGDNKYLDCPARMADGRHFTDYRPSCELNDLIRFDNKVSNSFQYRNFLKDNAESLMDKNREVACLLNCCGPCNTQENFNNGTMLPEQFMWVTDGRMMKMVVNDPNGLGTGRRYWTQTGTDATNCPNLPAAYPIAGGNKNNCLAAIDRLAYLGDYPQGSPMGRVAMPKGGEVPAPVPPLF